MTFTEFASEINDREQELAYGSETALLGDLNARMAELGGENWRESEAEVPAEEATWWRKAYELYAEDLQKSPDQQYDDLQDLYDAVRV